MISRSNINIYIIALALLLSSSLAIADCILPSPDGGTTPTEPQIKGKIVQVADNNVALIADNGKTHRFQANETTKRFTVYGGYVAANEIVVGQQAEVWFVDCEMDNPLAAVIRIKSTEPE